MKTIPELIKLYEVFFKKLTADEYVPPFPFGKTGRSKKSESPTEAQINSYISRFNIVVPDNIKEFWKSLRNTYQVEFYSDEEGTWDIGCSSIPLDSIADPTVFNLEPDSINSVKGKNFYETGLQLAFTDMKILFDGTKEESIYGLLPHYEPPPATATPREMRIRKIYLNQSLLYEPITDAIAPDFRTFFEHWLASGCFSIGQNKRFSHHWDAVKKMVPVKIPLKENLWLKYCSKLYKEDLLPEEPEKGKRSQPLKKFLEQFTPTDTIPASEETIARYKGLLPHSLLELWKLNGFGKYNDGIIEIVNPNEFIDLCAIIGKSRNGDYQGVPIILNSFGDFYFYQKTDEGKDFINLWSAGGGFFSGGDFNINSFFNNKLDPDQELFKKAKAKLGPLKRDEIYYYTPMEAYNRNASIKHIDKCNIHEFLTKMLPQSSVYKDFV
ncbi:MAG: GAD-like domain-containing protein [Bacteroidia bacterium]